MEQLLLLPQGVPSSRTPLSYFGAKRRSFFRLLETYLPKDLKELASPFVGGGTIELMIAAQGINVYASDNIDPLVMFFSAFLEDAPAVCYKANEMYPLSQDQLIHYRETRFKGLSKVEKAAIYWMMTKQSFMAIPLAHRTGYSSRYSEELSKEYFVYEHWLKWSNQYFHIECLDAFEAIKKHNNKMLYLDPPYVGKELLYGWHDDKTIFDHEKLAQVLKQHDAPWILSYGDHELVRDLYSEYEIVEPQWKYFTKHRSSAELLIVNT